MEGNAQFCFRYRGSNNTSLLFRSTTSICQLLRHFVPPRNATGHGRGRGLKEAFQFWYKDRFYTSPLCFATQNIGERPKKQLFLRRGVERSLFILLSSEKNEPRSAAAVIGLLGLSPQSPSGSAELAPLGQSSPFFLRLPCVFAAR